MTREKILLELNNTGFVERYVCQSLVNRSYLEDKINDIWVIICEIPEDRLLNLYKEGGINKIRQFVSGIIFRQCHSKTSPMYKVYDKYDYVEFTKESYGDYENYISL